MPGLPSRAAAVRLRLSNGFREGWTQRRDVHGFTASISNPRFAGEASDGGLPRPWSHGVANRGSDGSICTPANKVDRCTNQLVSSRPAK